MKLISIRPVPHNAEYHFLFDRSLNYNSRPLEIFAFRMSSLPGWVLDSELETHFISGDKNETAHTYYEPESLSQRRPTKRLEHWQQERKIGAGGFGKV